MRKIVFFSLIFFLGNSHLKTQDIIINEIMYNVDGSDLYREWVEIINISTKTIDMTGWRFFDGSNHKLNVVRGDVDIYPHEYVILASSASKFLNEHPSCTADVIDTVISLKNSEDTVALLDHLLVEVDTFTYNSSWNNSVEGKSIERKCSFGGSQGQANWHESLEMGGSPGFSNSTGALSSDVSGEKDVSEEIKPDDATTGGIYPVITEIAPGESQDFVELFFMEGGVCPGFNLLQGETIIKEFPVLEADLGDYWVVYFNSNGVDETSDTNNNGFLEFHSKHNGLTSTDSVISIRDLSGGISDAVSYSNQDRDSYIFSSSYDAVVNGGAWEPAVTTGETADYEKNSVDYSAGSQGMGVVRKMSAGGLPCVSSPGRSSDWWVSSVLTPGSGFQVKSPLNAVALEIISANPFSPYDADSSKRVLQVSYRIPDLAVKNLFVFDVNGRKRVKLIDDDITFQGVPLSGQGSGVISWNGCDSEGNICPMGIYIMYLEAVDSRSGSRWHSSKTCVLARPLK